MKIARVFCSKTSYCPTDEHSYFDVPDMFTPKDYDEVYISCTFTWDKQKILFLQKAWKENAKKVFIGGPAFDGPPFGYSGKPFIPGMFVKKGVIFTSRGCPNKCKFCFVPWREGKLQEMPIKEGNIIQDNNFLACSDKHRSLVYEMLKNQKGIEFKGGLEACRITSSEADKLRSLSIRSLFLACDTPSALKETVKAIKILKKSGFTRHHIYCYVLCGKNMDEEYKRCEYIFEAGCMPFVQLYRDENNSIKYSQKWLLFARALSRPASVWSIFNGKTKLFTDGK